MLHFWSCMVISLAAIKLTSTRYYDNSGFLSRCNKKGPYLFSKLSSGHYPIPDRLGQEIEKLQSWTNKETAPIVKFEEEPDSGKKEGGLLSLVGKDEDLKSLLKMGQLGRALKLCGLEKMTIGDGEGQSDEAITRERLEDLNKISKSPPLADKTNFRLSGENKLAKGGAESSDYLLSLFNKGNKLNDHNAAKNKLTQVYNKLADGIQSFEDIISVQKKKTDSSSTTAGPQLTATCLSCQLLGEVKSVNNIITIENVKGDQGNFTMVTLTKRKVIENKQNLKLPKSEGDGTCPKNGSSQLSVGFGQDFSGELPSHSDHLRSISSKDKRRNDQTITNSPIKKKITQVCKKLANDIQGLEDLMVVPKKKCDHFPTTIRNPPPPGQLMGEVKSANNIITIENVKGDQGNFTMVTLIKRKVIENKQNLKLPKVECDKNCLKNSSSQVSLGFGSEEYEAKQ